MAITLGDLRTYCREEVSPDASDGKAERSFMNWINMALSELWSRRVWDHARARYQSYLPAPTAGSNLDTTLGSTRFTLSSGTFTSTWLEENGFVIHTSGDDRTFEFTSIDAGGTFGDVLGGQEWTLASATGLTFKVFKEKYDLPDNAQRIEWVRLHQSRTLVAHQVPGVFDLNRQQSPTTNSSEPQFYTIRDGRMEIYPVPETARTLEITYVKGPPQYLAADADATEVDWPDQFKVLLQWAIALQGTAQQGPDRAVLQIDHVNAMLARAYSAVAQADHSRAQGPGPLGVRLPRTRGRRSWRAQRRTGSYVDE